MSVSKVSEQAIESYFLIYTSRMGILLKSVGCYHDQLYGMVWVMLSAMDKSVDFVKQFTLIFAVYAEYVLTEFNLTYIVSALSLPFQNKVDLRTIATWRLINLNNPKKISQIEQKKFNLADFSVLIKLKRYHRPEKCQNIEPSQC